jgi:hypothetical protein
MESVIFPAARFRMMRSHYYSSSLLHRKHIISHIDHLVPAAICVEKGLALFSRNRSHVSPALALPINMPNRHTGTLPNPVCSAAERCRVHVAVADPGDDTEFDDDHENSGNQG